VVRLSAPRTGRLYSHGNIPRTHFCWRLSRPQGHSAAGRIMSMKNSNDIIGNRTRDLPPCSAVRLWVSSYIIDTLATPDLPTTYVRLPSRPGVSKYDMCVNCSLYKQGGFLAQTYRNPGLVQNTACKRHKANKSRNGWVGTMTNWLRGRGLVAARITRFLRSAHTCCGVHESCVAWDPFLWG
jgi:hypothetical protein